MHEYKIEMKLQEELKPLEEICKKLVEATKHELDGGIEKVNTEEFGAVIDTIKDMCEAKEKVVKTCYYKEILKHMEKEEDEKEQEEKDMLRMLKEEYGMEEEDAKRFYRGQPRSRTSGRFMSRGDGRRNNGGRRGYEEMMPMDYRMDIEDYKMYPAEYWRDVDRLEGRMYYSAGSSSGGNSGGNSGGQSSGSSMSSGNMGGNSGGSSRGYEEYQRGYSEGRAEGYNQGRNDSNRSRNESRSERARRSYTETKEMNKDSSPESKQHRMKELDSYMNELNEDMKELIKDMTPEEKTMLKQKMAKLSTLV